MIRSSNQKKKELSENSNFEAEQNLVDFFDLLLKIDKRNSPYLYESKENYKNYD